MAGVLNNNAIALRSKAVLGQAPAAPSLAVKLFVNNVVPACTDAAAAYTECTLAGYGSVALTAANWTNTVANCVRTNQYPTQTWTFTAGGQTIYGHYVVDTVTGDVLWAEQWGTAFTVPAGGGTVTLTLQFQDQQCP